MAVRVGKCVMCGSKELCGLMFAPVNPATGKGYEDVFRNEKTGHINHPWTEKGKWVLVCKVCIPKAIGLKTHSIWTKRKPLNRGFRRTMRERGKQEEKSKA